MTIDPGEPAGSLAGDRTPWKLPPHIWHESARRAWLEAAELAFSEGFEEGFQASLAQRVILRLFYWRGIEVPELVRQRVRACTDLCQLRVWRDRAYEVNDPKDLFADGRTDRT
ncbi:hypothetical protein [Streptomyces sp. SID12501]|uniref:Uncharacterized protein n=1 Tax=Streptomyces sp. SID12501 TaxID=2706042 RepID=A0A6B3BP32_9ACTN|nr:hypothetical protein [Streptomyces sp. SID12501]NEC86107.1 hypothetical protein [Streptomyces sp. SID12501]